MPVGIPVFLDVLVTVVVFPFQCVLYDGIIFLQVLLIQACQVVLDVFLCDHCSNLDVQLFLKLLMLGHQGGLSVSACGMWLNCALSMI